MRIRTFSIMVRSGRELVQSIERWCWTIRQTFRVFVLFFEPFYYFSLFFFSFVAQLSAADCRPEISLFEFRSKGMRGGSICITYCRALCSNRYRRRSYTISHNILLNDTAVVYLRKRTSQHHAREIIMQRIALEIQIHLKSMVFRLCQV